MRGWSDINSKEGGRHADCLSTGNAAVPSGRPRQQPVSHKSFTWKHRQSSIQGKIRIDLLVQQHKGRKRARASKRRSSAKSYRGWGKRKDPRAKRTQDRKGGGVEGMGTCARVQASSGRGLRRSGEGGWDGAGSCALLPHGTQARDQGGGCASRPAIKKKGGRSRGLSLELLPAQW